MRLIAGSGEPEVSLPGRSKFRERLAPGTIYRISDLELASRLSFFLWSGLPDEELLNVAAQGKLKDPAVLEKQVRRMLADPKSKVLWSPISRSSG